MFLRFLRRIPYNSQVFMVDPTDANKTKAQEAIAAAATAEISEMMSLEHLDSLLLSEDPSFAADLEEVNSLRTDPNIDLDIVDIGPNLDSEQDNPWRNTIGLRKILTTLFPFLPALWDFKYRTIVRMRFFRTQIKTFLKHAGPNSLIALKSAADATGTFLKARVTAFEGLSGKLKILALVLTMGVLLTFAFVYRSLTHGVLPGDKELLTASLEEWAEQSYKYDPDTEMDSFYDSPRTIQNIMALPKMVVNLRPSGGSGPNPMAAMEFYLEGMSPEAIVEVKDREPEVRDLFQRTIEEMSFDEIDMPEGKQLLTERLRQALNAVLTSGKVRRVFIKESVIKP
ncbi:MAG: flagellar basal body-associated FliL family protein [Bdellovibrionaceae bacterium]|nr:flagellar basal body-associated FliL family protein [Pseudobdellovibrionaceae bacterium]